MNCTKWNNPENYKRVTTELLPKETVLPKTSIFALRKKDQLKHYYVQPCETTIEMLHERLDTIDIAIVETIATVKQVTLPQLYAYITLKSFDVTLTDFSERINTLLIYRVIQANDIVHSHEDNGLRYYELDYFGYQLALANGLPFHAGNRYISYSNRKANGLLLDTACDVKRILVGNQIILNLLINQAPMKRFGIMETFRCTDVLYGENHCLVRTTANVCIDDTSMLAYDVVRDTPTSYENLKDKIVRYYSLIHNTAYLESNYYNFTSYPQLVICGESLEHNIKIADYLRANGLWSKDDTILFTEDLLNMNHSLVSIYALEDDNSQTWYAI